MRNKRWLFATGLVLTAPAVVVMWIALVQAILSGDIGAGWSSGPGRLPAHATSNVQTAIITLVGTAMWLGGLWKVIRLWRPPPPPGPR